MESKRKYRFCAASKLLWIWNKNSHLAYFFHTGHYIHLAQETIFIPAGKHTKKKSSRHFETTTNTYKSLKIHSADNVRSSSYCLRALGCKLIISHASFKLRSPVSVPQIQIILAMKLYMYLSPLFAVQWETATWWERIVMAIAAIHLGFPGHVLSFQPAPLPSLFWCIFSISQSG